MLPNFLIISAKKSAASSLEREPRSDVGRLRACFACKFDAWGIS
jgi:hypothetical protein